MPLYVKRVALLGGDIGGAHLSLPPSGMASRALTARFTITCSNCEISAFTGQRSRPCMTSSATFSPISRRSSMVRSLETSPRSSTCGRSVCRREKASSCRTRLAARLAFCLICMMSWNDGSVGLWALSRKSVAIMMADEHVVEVVRDAAGELADRLHLLRSGRPGSRARAAPVVSST